MSVFGNFCATSNLVSGLSSVWSSWAYFFASLLRNNPPSGPDESCGGTVRRLMRVAIGTKQELRYNLANK